MTAPPIRSAATVRLRATVTLEYDAKPLDYGTDDPVLMADIDADNWHNDIMALFSSFKEEDFKVEVRPA